MDCIIECAGCLIRIVFGGTISSAVDNVPTCHQPLAGQSVLFPRLALAIRNADPRITASCVVPPIVATVSDDKISCGNSHAVSNICDKKGLDTLHLAMCHVCVVLPEGCIIICSRVVCC